MTAAAVVAVCVIIFIYAELAIGTGYYMYLITKRKATGDEEKQIKKYSIAAGVLFPITFAILIAGRAAEGRK